MTPHTITVAASCPACGGRLDPVPGTTPEHRSPTPRLNLAGIVECDGPCRRRWLLRVQLGSTNNERIVQRSTT